MKVFFVHFILHRVESDKIITMIQFCSDHGMNDKTEG